MQQMESKAQKAQKSRGEDIIMYKYQIKLREDVDNFHQMLLRIKKITLLFRDTVCVKTRLTFPKTDNIVLILFLKRIDYFSAIETWFRDHHSNPLVSVG